MLMKRYESLPQPTIVSVKSKVDLYPEEQRYKVKGEYQLVNKTAKKIDSLLIYIDRNTQIEDLIIAGARLAKDESHFGHYWFVPEPALLPGDSITMGFVFNSGWSPFKGHTSFNSIIDNGSFIRMSNYFPSLGYEAGNEITNKGAEEAGCC
jgi:ABC-2 type transport system permease protein